MDVVVPEMPLTMLCVPDGRIHVRVTVPNHPPVEAVLAAEKLIENLGIIESSMRIERRNRYMTQQHQAVYASVFELVSGHDMGIYQNACAAAAAALWCTLNHPKERNEMRKSLGSYLTASKIGHVGFEMLADGRVAMGVDQKPIDDDTMARAAVAADAMNAEGAKAAAKTAN